jgi:hypothetical protein
MEIRLRRLASGIAAGAIVASLAAGSASAAASTETNRFEGPVAFTIISPCTGHALSFSGDVVSMVKNTVTEAGHVLVTVHGHDSHVVGTDLTTGQTFRLNFSGGSSETYDASGAPLEFTVGITNNFVGQGPGNNLIQHELEHVTINANGEVTVSFQHVSIECH